MANETTRIVNLPQASEVSDGLNFVVDSVNGTKRSSAADVADYVLAKATPDTTLAVSGKPADAKATGDALDELQDDFDSLIEVGDVQPQDTANKIWVKETVVETQVPTEDEFEDLRDSIAPEYSATGRYAVGDHVYYNGNLYKCNTAVTSDEAWTAAHWTQVVIGGEIADIKEDLNSLGLSVVNGKLCVTYLVEQ